MTANFEFVPQPGSMFGEDNDRVTRSTPRWATVYPDKVTSPPGSPLALSPMPYVLQGIPGDERQLLAAPKQIQLAESSVLHPPKLCPFLPDGSILPCQLRLSVPSLFTARSPQSALQLGSRVWQAIMASSNSAIVGTTCSRTWCLEGCDLPHLASLSLLPHIMLSLLLQSASIVLRT